MHQENVISQLLAWIEQSLDQPLTLDSIAAKSGYSNGTCNECSSSIPAKCWEPMPDAEG